MDEDNLPVPWARTDAYNETPMTLQDLKLQAISYALRSKPLWWEKYKDNEIRAKWKAEALATPVEGDKLLESEVEYVLQELAGYEKMRDEATGIQQSCYGRIYESDTLISPPLQDRLKAAVRMLENVPDEQKDWHPGSNEQVLDLVHPSLYPIVFERTMRYPSTEDLEPQKRTLAKFQPMEAPDSETLLGADWSISTKFAWLSTDFKLSSDGGSAECLGYINNLHPSNTELYKVIEELVARFSFLWSRVLTDLLCYSQSSSTRIEDGYTWKDELERPDRKEEESDEEYDVRLRAFAMQRAIELPTVPSEGYTEDISFRPKKYNLHGKEIQVIVKLANIHLTPEKPTYPGGSWHIEGMANERILASGIYYYDSENITDNSLQFRIAVKSDDMSIEQDDHLASLRVWGLKRHGPANQIVGTTPTPQNRCLAFPNVYQHKVSPFQLADPTKPGHRKILALFLLDPEHPRFNTTDIPPQQAEWYEIAMQQTEDGSPIRKLPAELLKEITKQLPNLMTLEEAKRYRLQLMEERTAFVSKQDENYFATEFNFCEH